MQMMQHTRPRSGLTSALAIIAGFTLITGCYSDKPFAPAEQADGAPLLNAAAAGLPSSATGSVEIVWPGGRGRVIPPGEEKLAFADFEAFPAWARLPARGTFTYRVLNVDGSPHREIVADLSDVVVKPETRKAWFTGVVVSDVKICSGGSCDGDDGDGGCSGDGGSHDGGGCTDGGCSGGGTDGGCSDGGSDGGCGGGTDGGCSDGGSDGGCSGGGTDGGCSDGGSDGGCSGGGTDGGCSDGGSDGGCSDGGTDGGCNGGGSHDDGGSGGCSGGGSHDSGGSGGCTGSGTGGGGVSGKDPRVGQVVVIKVHDIGTPGTAGDGITWKWFAAGTVVDMLVEPKCLCKKDIIGGNLVVHPPVVLQP